MKKLIAGAILATVLLAVSVLTDHFSNARLGTNDAETVLGPAAVTGANFGKVCSYLTDGDVVAQPLYVSAVIGMTGQASAANVLVIATMHGSLYAFPADRCGAAIWRTNFGAVQAANSYPNLTGALIYNRENGCKSTPAVDAVNKIIYAVCSTATTWVLRKISLTDGSSIATQTITGTVNAVTFCPLCQQNSAGVTLANNNVYVTFGSMSDSNDHGHWRGWVIGYAQSDLSSIGAFCTTCENANGGGGIWQSGGGISVDGDGNIYAITGNGSGTPAVGNLCLAVVKLSSTLSVLDWYAPTDHATYNGRDWDFSTGRPMLIPGTNLVVFGVKDFNVYSIDGTCMGNIGGAQNGCTAPQVFATGTQGSITDHQGIYSCLYVPGLHKAYFPNTAGHVYAFSLTGTTWNTTPVVSSGSYEFPGSQMVAGCDNGANCVVWGTMPVDTSSLFNAEPGKLVAFNPTTLDEYWSSAGRTGDALGTLAKLTAPTVAAGKIYVGTLDSAVVMYGVATRRILVTN